MTGIAALMLGLGFLAGPPPDTFHFDYGPAHRAEGQRALSVTVDREGNLAIFVLVANVLRELPPVRLPPEEAAELWKAIDAAGIVEFSEPPRPGVPDEGMVSFALSRAGAEPVTMRLRAADVRRRPLLAALGVALSGLIVRHTGRKPVLPVPPPAPPEIAAATFEEGGAVVVALWLAPEAAAPVPVFVARSVARHDEPGDYGVFPADGFRQVDLTPGAVTLLRMARGDAPEPGTVLAVTARPAGDVDVHGILDGEGVPGTVLFDSPAAGDAVTVDRHLVAAGGKVTVRVRAPGGDFFHPEKMEIVRVPRRIALSGDDPDGPKGHVRVEWAPDDRFAPLRGEAGERRIRSHFTDPKCPWAERHVGWMEDLWMLEYREPAELVLTLDTTPVRRGGRVPDTWRGYGAFTVESIYPNGFGGSSANLGLPPVLVVPAGTPVREADAR